MNKIDWHNVIKWNEESWQKVAINNGEISVLNCRPHSLSKISGSSKPEIAASFLRMLQSDGSEYKGMLPQNNLEFDCSLKYNVGGLPPEGIILRAGQMEDKFNVYYYDDVLYFVRSLTGQLTLTAHLEYNNGTVEVIYGNFIKEMFEGQLDYVRQMLDFLIKSHCFDMVVPFPIPKKYKDYEPKMLFPFGFMSYGRRGWLGTFDETIGLWGELTYQLY